MNHILNNYRRMQFNSVLSCSLILGSDSRYSWCSRCGCRAYANIGNLSRHFEELTFLKPYNRHLDPSPSVILSAFHLISSLCGLNPYPGPKLITVLASVIGQRWMFVALWAIHQQYPRPSPFFMRHQGRCIQAIKWYMLTLSIMSNADKCCCLTVATVALKYP